MGIVTIPSYLYPPPPRQPPSLWGNPNGGSSSILDAAGKKAAWIFYPPKTGNIDAIRWYLYQTTTNGSLDARLETVDPATGFPTGTLWGTNTNISRTIPSFDFGDKTDVFTAAAAITDLNIPIAAVLNNVSGNYQMIQALRGSSDDSWHIGSAYLANYNNVAWALGASVGNQPANYPCLGVRYSDGSYYKVPGVLYCTPSAVSLNSAPTTLVGTRLRMPVPVRTWGGYFQATANIGVDWTMRLYDSDGSTVIGSCTGDKDIDWGNIGQMIRAWSQGPISLLANTYYRMSLHTGSGNIAIYTVDFPAAATMDCFEGGQDWHKTVAASLTPANDAAWTQTLTTKLMMGLVIDGLEAGGSGNVFVIED
jgi:hypothetical protein